MKLHRKGIIGSTELSNSDSAEADGHDEMINVGSEQLQSYLDKDAKCITVVAFASFADNLVLHKQDYGGE